MGEDTAALKERVEIRVVEGELSKLVLGPGDVLVFHMNKHITPAIRDYLEKAARRVFGNRKGIILENGVRLGVITDEEAQKVARGAAETPD